jgi:hypothetical protein
MEPGVKTGGEPAKGESDCPPVPVPAVETAESVDGFGAVEGGAFVVISPGLTAKLDAAVEGLDVPAGSLAEGIGVDVGIT